ncbi:MAG: type II secretion system protein [Sedimentisphaeraceae bacterium JB056]
MKKKAFTLIELLVVISIIAVLMSILMPALSKVREQGKAVVCGTNVKNNLNALTMYAMDNKDTTVPRLYESNIIMPWDVALRPYFGTDISDSEQDYVVCPADRKKRGTINDLSGSDKQLFEDYTGGEILPRSYMLNGALENLDNNGQGVATWWSDGTNSAAKYSKVYEPAKTLWLYDHFIGANDDNHKNIPQGSFTQIGCVQGSNYWSGIWGPPSVVGWNTYFNNGTVATVSDQHPTGGNWGFIDAHVEYLKHNKTQENNYTYKYGGEAGVEWAVSWADTKTKKSAAR